MDIKKLHCNSRVFCNIKVKYEIYFIIFSNNILIQQPLLCSDLVPPITTLDKDPIKSLHVVWKPLRESYLMPTMVQMMVMQGVSWDLRESRQKYKYPRGLKTL